eukprot:3583868-Rhodomonas_salina.1
MPDPVTYFVVPSKKRKRPRCVDLDSEPVISLEFSGYKFPQPGSLMDRAVAAYFIRLGERTQTQPRLDRMLETVDPPKFKPSELGMRLAIRDMCLLYGGLSRHSGAPINMFDNIKASDTGFDLVNMWKISTHFRPPGAVWPREWDPRDGWHASDWLILHGPPNSLEVPHCIKTDHTLPLSAAYVQPLDIAPTLHFKQQMTRCTPVVPEPLHPPPPPGAFAKNGIPPSWVNDVEIKEARLTARVIVPETQSLQSVPTTPTAEEQDLACNEEMPELSDSMEEDVDRIMKSLGTFNVYQA